MLNSIPDWENNKFLMLCKHHFLPARGPGSSNFYNYTDHHRKPMLGSKVQRSLLQGQVERINGLRTLKSSCQLLPTAVRTPHQARAMPCLTLCLACVRSKREGGNLDPHLLCTLDSPETMSSWICVTGACSFYTEMPQEEPPPQSCSVCVVWLFLT